MSRYIKMTKRPGSRKIMVIIDVAELYTSWKNDYSSYRGLNHISDQGF